MPTGSRRSPCAGVRLPHARARGPASATAPARRAPLRRPLESRACSRSAERSRHEAAVTRGEPLHLGEGMSGQLLHDALAVRLDGAARDEQLARDLVVRPAADDELEDLALAARQPIERPRRSGAELGLDRGTRRARRQIADATEDLANRVEDL